MAQLLWPYQVQALQPQSILPAAAVHMIRKDADQIDDVQIGDSRNGVPLGFLPLNSLAFCAVIAQLSGGSP